jgi:diguanylate cyclase (GGDEF)-like protein
MISSRSRLVAGILSGVTLIACLIFSSSLSTGNIQLNKSGQYLFSTSIFAFNIPILLAWIAAGIPGGAAIAAFSALAVIFFDLRAGLYGYNIFAASFVLTTAVGYAFMNIKASMDRSRSLKLEKAEEEINLLTNALKEKKASISSLEEKLGRYSLLKDVSESLSMVLALDQLNELIVKEAARTIGKPGRALMYLVDSQKQDLMLTAAIDESRTKMKKGDLYDHWVLRNRKSLIIEDVTKDFRFPAEEAEEAKKTFRSLISQPLIIENKVIGLLRFDSAIEACYTQDDLRLLDIISDVGAVAVQNALLYARTQELAIRDSLTGLVVRRYFMDRFHHELKRSARKGERLSILLIDIDHFKDYNDKYGHAAGDLVLKHLAKTISGMVDQADVVGRYGGEEIVALLFGKSKSQAAAKAEEIRKAIMERSIMLRRQETYLTVSVGVSSSPEDASAEVELLRIADGRLYKAKSLGRNRVCAD